MNELSPVCGYLRQPSMLDFRGSLAAVFFTSGCNFRCGFCHNAELLQAGQPGLPWARLAAVCGAFLEEWVDGAVITGGEPTLSPELPELIAFFKEHNLKVKLDTNGSSPSVLEAVLPALDYVAMDLKCGLEDYHLLTGFENTRAIAASVELLKKSQTPYELRTTIVEEFHTRERLEKMLPLLSGASRYVLQPFLPRESLPDERFQSYKRTSPAKLLEIREMFGKYAAEVTVL